MISRRFFLQFSTLLIFHCMAMVANASTMSLLDDVALADVRGRDGISLLVDLNVHIGSSTFGTYDTSANPAYLSLNNIEVKGLVAAMVDILPGVSGSPDYSNIFFPAMSGANTLQSTYDLIIAANGKSFGTSIMFQNFAFAGSSVQWTTSNLGGIAFGLGLNVAIDNILLQPNGRSNTSGQMAMSGIKLGAASGNGFTPWVLADVATQPGFFNIPVDSNGASNFQLGIGWPTGQSDAASGSLKIDNVMFNTPTGNVNLGASSIGSMQIQYLNIKFKS